MPYQHFTMDERDTPQAIKAKGLAIDKMARIIGKDPSSLYLELSRNANAGLLHILEVQ
jgi:IS30 family transposase